MDQNTQILYDLFMNQTVVVLGLHRKMLGVWTVKSNARKAEMARCIANWIVEDPARTLKAFPLYELRFLQHLCKAGDNRYMELNRTAMPLLSYSLGLIRIDSADEYSATFPMWFETGVRSIFAPYIDAVVAEIENGPRNEYEQFFWGCLALYGAIDYFELFNVIDEHYKDLKENLDFNRFLRLYPVREQCEYMHYLVHPCADIHDVVREREEKKMGKRAYRKFSKKDILDAGSTMPYSSVWHFHEEGQSLISALESVGYTEDRLVYALHRIWDNKQSMGGTASSFNALVQEILGGQRIEGNNHFQRLVDAILHYFNAIPCWVFKGRSSDEMFKKDKRGPEKLANAQAVVHQMANISRQASSFPKVGRNDPCPCGSGLKYKNCHGKNLS